MGHKQLGNFSQWEHFARQEMQAQWLMSHAPARAHSHSLPQRLLQP
jgi:hypothetical protein